jgi:RNA 3'-terminal phosphate cyclase (ATP)
MTGSLILIDGSHGEGGGALVRTAISMSALTQLPVRINQVRGGTNHPGVDIEDLTLIRALAKSCGAEVTGAEAGSSTLSFLPTKRCSGLKDSLDLDRGVQPGRVPNVNVLLNAMLPVMAKSGIYSRLSLSGETYGTHSLCYDYFANVTLVAQRRFGLYAFPEQLVAGFGREGGGEVSIEVEPSALTALNWSDRGKLLATRATIAIGELPMTIGHRALSHLANLVTSAKMPVDVEIFGVDSSRPGLCITVWSEYENGIGGATAMGAKGIRAEAVAQAAFEDMYEWARSDASVDPYLADQILPTAIFADGETTFKVSRLTKRFLTIVWVIKQFLPIHITVKGAEGEPGEIVVRR